MMHNAYFPLVCIRSAILKKSRNRGANHPSFCYAADVNKLEFVFHSIKIPMSQAITYLSINTGLMSIEMQANAEWKMTSVFTYFQIVFYPFSFTR